MADHEPFKGFSSITLPVNDVNIHARVFRHADAAAKTILLLHGFPQTHFIWHKVVDTLCETYSVVCPDLRGYGDSEKPAGMHPHTQYSKRVMASDMVELMRVLQLPKFHLVGHDRGARVAHRLALDHAHLVERLCVIDISPTLTMYERTDMEFARAYYHWFFLIQPAPLPESLMAANAGAVLKTFLGNFNSGGKTFFTDAAMAEYERCFSGLKALHAACEDYRASAGIDLEHDRQSDAEGIKITAPMLVLWGERGVVARLFQPLSDWRAKCSAAVQGAALPSGHYIAEEVPELLLGHLLPFLAQG